jgi:hypothetical protein
MKKALGAITLLSTTILLGTVGPTAFAAGGNATTQGTVTITQDTTPTGSTDPTGPTDPTDPGDGGGNQGTGSDGLILEYVSNFDFGDIEYAGEAKTVIAKPDEWGKHTDPSKDHDIANQIQVSDKRSTHGEWNVTVQMDTPFTGQNGDLGTSSITLKDLSVNNFVSTGTHHNLNLQTNSSIQINPDGKAVTVVGTPSGKDGRGHFHIDFGTKTDVGVVLNLESELNLTSGDTYTTDLTWTLSDSPL